MKSPQKENNIKKSIKSISVLWLGSIIGSGSSFLLYILLARELGVEGFGILSSALALTTIFTIIGCAGIPQTWLKIFGKEGWEGTRWIGTSFKMITATAAISCITMLVWTQYGPNDYQTQGTLKALALFMVGQVGLELVAVKLQLEERYKSLFWWQTLPNATRLLGVWLISESQIGFDVLTASWVYAATGMACIMFAIAELKRINANQLKLKGHPDKKITGNLEEANASELCHQCWPFAVAMLFAYIYTQSDLVMVKYIVGDLESGYYGSVYTILTATLLLPAVLYQKFLLPKFHRWANHNRERFYSVYRMGNKLMLIAGITAALFLIALSNWVFTKLFGIEFQNAIPIAYITLAGMPIYFLSYSIAGVLTTQNFMIKKIKCMGIVALINIVLNYILIKQVGAIGASIATVISYTVLLTLYYRIAEGQVFTKEIQQER